jgi:hypothetical protein
MNSIGDLIDKLVIENIKIFTVREKLHNKDISEEEYVKLTNNMITLNENRGIISNYLDEKIDKVVSGQEKNLVLKKIKTYNIHKHNKK